MSTNAALRSETARGWLAAALVVAALVVARLYWQYVNVTAPMSLSPNLSMEWPLAFVFGVAAAMVALRLRPLRGSRPRALPELLVWALVAWTATISIGAAKVSGNANWVLPGVAPYLLALVVVVVGRGLAVSGRQLQVGIVVAALLLAATVVLDAENAWWPRWVQRPGGLLPSRNFAGEYLALALPVCLTALTGKRRWLLLLVGVALAWTRCRNAWLGAACGSLIALWQPGPVGRRGAGLAVALVLAGGIASGFLPQALRWKESNPGLATLSRLVDTQNGSGAMRVRQHEATIDALQGRWWQGMGPGLWQLTMLERHTPIAWIQNRHPHSDYLRAASDGGVVALAALATWLALALVLAWRRRDVVAGALGTLAALVVMSSADFPLARLESLTLVSMLVAALSRQRVPADALAACSPQSIILTPSTIALQ